MDVAAGAAAHAARLINQPFRKHAKTGRPLVLFKSAMTLDGKVATQHAATRSGSPARRAALVAPLARGGGRGGGGDRHGARGRPAAHRARRGRHAPAQPRGVRLRGAPAAHRASSCAPRRRCRSTSCCSRAAVAHRDRRARGRRRRGDRRHGRERGGARARTRSTSSARASIQSLLLEGGPHLAGAFLDAGEVDEVRVFVAPDAGRRPPRARRARGPGRRGDRRRAPGAVERGGADRRRRADPARSRSGECSPASSQALGTVAAVERDGDGARLEVETPLAAELSRRATRSRSTASA